MPVPLLILSDDPSQSSGLARITRDLATILTGQPEWRIATLGWMGTGSSKLPWMGYHMFPNETGELSLPQVWDEFSQGEWGVVMTIWDLSRLGWLCRPDLFDSPAREWLAGARGHRFKLWGYIPIDSTGPGNRLTTIYREVLLGFDRLLAYSPWGEDVIRNTIGADESAKRGLDWLPHGLGATWTPNAANDPHMGNDHNVGNVRPLTSETWHISEVAHYDDPNSIVDLEPRVGGSVIGDIVTADLTPAEQVKVKQFKHQYYGWRGDKLGAWSIGEDEGSKGGAEKGAGLVGAPDNCDDPGGSAVGAGSKEEAVPVVRIGVVATNQARKDWGLVAAIARGLREVRPDVRWWWHCNVEILAWSLPALLEDFAITDIVEVTSGVVTDEQLAAGYRTCALTIAPGLGEGFCYPAFESLACSIPVLHGDYGGCASLMRTCDCGWMLIEPVTYRIEGQYNAVRPVHDPQRWVNGIQSLLLRWEGWPDLGRHVQHLKWDRLKYPWRRWMREGL